MRNRTAGHSGPASCVGCGAPADLCTACRFRTRTAWLAGKVSPERVVVLVRDAQRRLVRGVYLWPTDPAAQERCWERVDRELAALGGLYGGGKC